MEPYLPVRSEESDGLTFLRKSVKQVRAEGLALANLCPTAVKRSLRILVLDQGQVMGDLVFVILPYY